MQVERQQSKDFWWICVDFDVVMDTVLSSTARFVFTVLCRFASIQNRSCWPSNATVAGITGYSTRTVMRAYEELESRGMIARVTRVEKGKGKTSSLTKLIGHHAECYATPPQSAPCDTDDTTLVTPVSHEVYQGNYIKTLPTGGDDLPEQSAESENKKQTPENTGPAQEKESQKCEEAIALEEVPDALRTTAKYFLHETGRSSLTLEDLKALRRLNLNHTPARIQREIDTACDRFRRRAQSVTALTFSYIANALEYQQSRKKREDKTKSESALGGVTSADVERIGKKLTVEELDRELDRIEADVNEGRLL